jgi:GDP-D-mannose dehydratase
MPSPLAIPDEFVARKVSPTIMEVEGSPTATVACGNVRDDSVAGTAVESCFCTLFFCEAKSE